MKKEIRPPKWIFSVLSRFCDQHLLEGIFGDLYETFQDNVKSKGEVQARLIYMVQGLGFVRMIFKKKEKRISTMKAIWINYLLTSFRSIKKQKALFGINLIGLIMAISCSLFALIYIHDELSFDRIHADADRTFRLYKRHINIPENVDHLTYETSGMMGPTMKEEYPEVEESLRVLPWWHTTILTHKKKNIASEKIYFADSNFFDFFDFNVLAGERSTLLTAPSSIVLSEGLAQKIFGNENPLGKKVIWLNYKKYTVTGVFEEPPRQSSLQFDAIISWSTTVPGVGPLNMSWMNNWLAQGIYTFVKLAPDASPGSLVDKLPDMMQRHFEERANQYFLKLQPFHEMHLYGEDIRGTERMKSGSITFVYMLGFSAFLIFLIASVNYINITLSRATQTKTEVGIRKVMGSSRKQLMQRFIAETFFSTVIASLLSFLLILWLLPVANTLSGKDMPLSALFQPIVLVSIGGFIVGISLIVGTYPALVLSSPPVSSILKSNAGMVSTTGWFRKVLLTLQYVISIFLIICTIMILRQTSFLENKPLGFNKEQVLVLNIGNEVSDQVDILEAEMRKHPNILSVSTTRSTIGDGSYTTTVLPEGATDESAARIFGVDQEFFETYGISLLEGRTFRKGSRVDSNRLVVNKTLVDLMRWKDPVGKHIRFSANSKPIAIIGVVADFHIHSLATNTVEPMILNLNTTTNWYTAAKIGTGDIDETILYLNEVWDRLARRTPFNYYFLDQWFNEQYTKERQLLKVSTLYSIISILLCGLGLYGLTSLLLLQRTKEISIRKVLGAPLTSIVSMMNKQFMLIILVSFAIAAPLSYYLVAAWLDQFAYKMTISFWPFILSGTLTFVVSVIIVSMLSIKTANNNPSKNLSTE